MPSWTHGQQQAQQMYRGYYPNVTASGTPMNYGYAPPAYTSGYGPTTTTTGYAASRNYISSTGQSFGHYSNAYGGVPYTSGGYDPAVMNFGN
jgi:hypothetical protein